MSTTAKHFTCYSALIGLALFLFGLYHKIDLQYTASQQKIVDNTTATLKAVADSQQAIQERDTALQVANNRLDKSEEQAKTLAEQVSLANELLLKQPTTWTATQSPIQTQAFKEVTTTSPDGQSQSLVTVTPDNFKILTDKIVSCQKCQNSLDVAQKNVVTLQATNSQQANLITAYQVIESKEPHTKFQKFRKGIRWVFLLGH